MKTMHHKFFLLTLLLAVPCLAAPREVNVTLTTQDGKPFVPGVKFVVFNDRGSVQGGWIKSAAQVHLENGEYSLWLVPDAKSRVPGGLWRGLEVGGDGPQIWDLTMPLFAAVQGKIVLSDGKPAANWRVSVQSGTWDPMNKGPYGGAKEGQASGSFTDPREWWARGARHAYNVAVTAADGTFTLSGLAPNNYALDVLDRDSKKVFTIPFVPALEADAKDGQPTKIGTWTVPENGWDWLFDTELRHGGAPAKFDGQGEMKVANNVLRLGTGNDLTGVTWDDKALPRENYEISLDARRAEGSDFFCGLTFPVGDKPLTWIVGGWGGTVVGLSNVNGFSADENETTQTRDFAMGRWYRLRLRVAKAKIEAWIDDDKLIDLPTKEKEFSIRWSVEPSQPLGIATWKTTGELRDVRWRRLDASEVAAIEKSVAENP